MQIQTTNSWNSLPEQVRNCRPILTWDRSRLFPSGRTYDYVIGRAWMSLPVLYDWHCPPLEPVDLLFLLAETLAGVHVTAPRLHLKEVDHLGDVPSAFMLCTMLVIQANPEFARMVGVLPRLHVSARAAQDFVIQRYIDWNRDVRHAASTRKLNTPRGRCIYKNTQELFDMCWKPDTDRSVNIIEKVVIDNVGGNEARASNRETLGVDPMERGRVAISFARMSNPNAVGLLHVVDGHLTVNGETLSASLDAMLGRGAPRKANQSSLTELKHEIESKAARPDTLAALSELRELSDLRRGGSFPLLDEVVSLMATQAQDSDIEVVARYIRRFVFEMAEQSAAVRAAGTYELLRSVKSQDEVAAAFGVTRKQLRVALPQAKQIVDRACAA